MHTGEAHPQREAAGSRAENIEAAPEEKAECELGNGAVYKGKQSQITAGQDNGRGQIARAMGNSNGVMEPATRGNGKTTRPTARGNFITPRGTSTKGRGAMIR